MNYLRQVQRAIDYIEQHLDEEIELMEISQYAGVSHWHFQRIFSALTKETLKSYIRSRRLANARLQLLTTDLSILDIALAAGFDAQASFTRAFKKAFSMPPGSYRKLGSKHLHLEKLKVDEQYIRHLHRGVTLEPELKVLPERTLVGMKTEFWGSDSERNNIGKKLPPLWDSFMARLGEVQGAYRSLCYGLIQPTEPNDDLLEYFAAVEVFGDDRNLAAPEGMIQRIVPEQDYAVFTHYGDAQSIDHTVSYIYSTWLMQSGRHHSYQADIEIYDEQYQEGSEESLMYYAIPLAR